MSQRRGQEDAAYFKLLVGEGFASRGLTPLRVRISVRLLARFGLVQLPLHASCNVLPGSVHQIAI